MLTAAVASDRGDALGELGLAVGSLVAVDNTLGDSLVQLAAGLAHLGFSYSLVAGGDSLAYTAHVGLELRLDVSVADAGLFVGLDALDLRLNVRHD